MNNVVEEGDRENDSHNPVISDPRKCDAQFRKEGRQQQGEHRQSHDSVKEPSTKRMPGNALRNLGGIQVGSSQRLFGMRDGGFCPISYVNRMDDQEQQAADGRNPQKAPRNVDRDLSTPRTFRPFYEVHVSSWAPAPRIARRTKFLINGTL